MNISSILITIVGIIIILALYVVSRVGQGNLSKKETSKLPEIKDKDGNVFTSILDDIPASDDLVSTLQKKTTSNSDTKVKESKTNTKKQVVLFISAKDEKGIDGLLIQQTLINNGLKLGDKDIYHFYLESNNKQKSLFRIANGVEPWTLKDDDLINQTLVGISMVMLLPNTIDNTQATSMFMQIAETITEQVNGILQNQQQELLSETDKTAILDS